MKSFQRPCILFPELISPDSVNLKWQEELLPINNRIYNRQWAKKDANGGKLAICSRAAATESRPIVHELPRKCVVVTPSLLSLVPQCHDAP